MSKRILLIEDNEDLAKATAAYLEHEGFQVLIYSDADQAWSDLKGGLSFDLVIVDLMLPGMSGLEFCRRVRSLPEGKALPILMATARGEPMDRIIGLEVGADDYMVKPVNLRELFLRAGALLRRANPADASEVINTMTAGRLTLDIDGFRALVDGEAISLTALEFRVLMLLVSRRGRVQTRALLLKEVWGREGIDYGRSVDTLMKRLRSKLGPVGSYVETVRGVGYRFVVEGEPH